MDDFIKITLSYELLRIFFSEVSIGSILTKFNLFAQLHPGNTWLDL